MRYNFQILNRLPCMKLFMGLFLRSHVQSLSSNKSILDFIYVFCSSFVSHLKTYSGPLAKRGLAKMSLCPKML